MNPHPDSLTLTPAMYIDILYITTYMCPHTAAYCRTLSCSVVALIQLPSIMIYRLTMVTMVRRYIIVEPQQGLTRPSFLRGKMKKKRFFE
jgi:hypothetical protein